MSTSPESTAAQQDIRILISCHKESACVTNEVLQPIQVGCALTGRHLPGVMHDDEGENISDRNRRYSEVTAQYWAWKHLHCDYCGIFHYRRYLSFRRLSQRYDSWGCIPQLYPDARAKEMLGLRAEDLREVVRGYDIILPEKRDLRRMPKRAGRDMWGLYLSSGYLHRKDLEIMLEVLREKHPEDMPCAERYLRGKTTYLNNLFIMRWEIFDDYCAWLFDILEACDRRIDYTDYSTEATRTIGHLAERLLNIYVERVRKERGFRILELQTVFFKETEPLIQPGPVFAEDNVAIALVSNEHYVPYTAVFLQSLKEHLSTDRNYDILLFHTDITERSREKLRLVLGEGDNRSLRFLNIASQKWRFENASLHGHFRMEVYYRLLLPELLTNYEKVLYLDCDMVLLADPAELYRMDVGGALLAATRDADTAGLYNGFHSGRREYSDERLKIRAPYDYFQAGVMLLNLAAFRQSADTGTLIRFALSDKWELQDQDVLNYFAQGKVRFIDMSWNVLTDYGNIRVKEIIGSAPKRHREEYARARKHPKIIHYAGPEKPWDYPASDMAEIFWDYAKRSGFYEVLLRRMGLRCAEDRAGGPMWRRKRQETAEDTVGIPGAENEASTVFTALLDPVFPRYTRRREAVKAVWRMLRRDK